MSKKINVLVIPSDRSGVSKFRSVDPHIKLEQLYPDDFHVDIDYKANIDDENFLKKYDIIHFHRTFGPYEQMERRMGQLRKLGIKTIMDLDDYWRPTMDHPAYQLIINEQLDKKIINNLLYPDYVMTTTPIFADIISKYNKNVVVMPNAIDHTERQFIPENNEKQTDRVRIGWLGGSCYDEQTEILTENGFKFFKDVLPNETVATLNPNTNEIEYQLPVNYICEPYDGIMYSANTKEINYVVTPNHKMYASTIENLSHKKINFQLQEAETIYGKNFHVKRDGIWVGEEQEYFMLPKYAGSEFSVKDYSPKQFKMDDWLKFFGFWLAEGWTSKTPGLFQTGITQKKDDKILQEMEEILKSFGFSTTRTKDTFQVRCFDRQLWNYLSQFGDASTKFIPKELKNLSPRQLNILFDYYIIGDGHIENNDGKRIRSWSISKQLTDDLNEITLKIGKICTITNRGIRNSIMLDGREVNGKFDCFQIGYGGNGKHNRRNPLIRTKHQKTVNYKGNIYCVEVPNHILFVRRNGKSFWCGNSHLSDLQILTTTINKLHGDGYDKKTQFVVCGFDVRGEVTEYNPQTQERKKRKILPHETVWVRYEEIFTDNYKTLNDEKYLKYLQEYINEPYDDLDQPYRRIWTKPVTTYAKNYNNFDISLAPLKEHTFNQVKSQLKVIEAGFHKKALIAQNYGPYTIDLKHAYVNGEFVKGGNALLVDSIKNHKQWHKYIKLLVDNPSLVVDLSEQLYEDIMPKYNLEKVTRDRAEFYKSIVN